MAEQITYSTFGSCLTRDIFGFADSDKKFSHIRNVGFISPLTQFEKKTDDTAEFEKECIDAKIETLVMRNAVLDLKGDALNYLCEKNSDFLIVDFYDIRLPMLIDINGNKITYRNFSSVNPLLVKYFSRPNCQPTILSVCDIDLDIVYKQIDKLAEAILSNWAPSQIILLEPVLSSVLLSKDKLQSYFHDIRGVLLFCLTLLMHILKWSQNAIQLICVTSHGILWQIRVINGELI